MSRHRAPRGGDTDSDTSAMPRDPQHRPVLLYVASSPRQTGHRPAPPLVTMSTSLGLVALLTLTLVSAWQGWQVAWSDSGTTPPSAAPVVPEVPRVDADTPVAPALPAAPVPSVPSGTPRAEDPQGAGGQVVADRSGQPYVGATMVTPAVPGGGAPAQRTDPVPVPSPATPHTAAAAAADPAPVGNTAATATQAPPSTAVAPSRAAAASTTAAESTAASVAAGSSPASAEAPSEDSCPRSRAPDRPSPADATRGRWDDGERDLDHTRLEEPEHDEPSGG